MLSTISKQIIEAGGILSLPLGERNQILGGIVYPLPITPNKTEWYALYHFMGIPELTQLFLVENDIRMIKGLLPIHAKLYVVNDRQKLETRDVMLDKDMYGNLSTVSFKIISGIPYFWNREQGICLNCHHIDGNHRNDTPSNLGVIRNTCHGQVHNSHCILSLENAPYIPLVHIMNNVFGIDWFITENGIERSETYTYVDVEKDVLPVLEAIEKGKSLQHIHIPKHLSRGRYDNHIITIRSPL
jgi:hypothetical protein